MATDSVQSETRSSPDAQDTKTPVAASRHAEAMSEPVAVPRKLMTSTWHHNTSPWKLITEAKDPFKALLHDFMYHGTPPRKEGKVPFISVWRQHKWVFPRAIPPTIAQYISMKRGYTWSPAFTFAIYAIWFLIFAKMLSLRLKALIAEYGYLDPKSPRNHTPDTRTSWTVIVILAGLVVRTLCGTVIAYDRNELPHLSLWLPVNAFIYVSIFDFYYYWYHRVMHESDFLWRFHKVHHMVKHPTYVLTGFADIEQDIIDVFVIPVLAMITYRIDFFTWWICTIYIVHTEALGHSGLRAVVPAALAAPFLQPFGLELDIEDHDLHHRNGWRKSFNYGKQTKLWDTLFGTARSRIECVPENVAWN